MTYKENLYFIASCLSISSNEKNKEKVISQLNLNNIDWDKIVKISSSHYVLPALYHNLKNQGLLSYLPDDLVNYMFNIAEINRERNKKIIQQVIKLNNLLLANNIYPIFFKGAGNLFANIYTDITERMIGDIDFIVSAKSYTKAINILIKDGYKEVEKVDYESPFAKHHPRMVKDRCISAIEIHKELVSFEYNKEFNYSLVNKDKQVFKKISVFSYENKLNMSIISSQINDNGYYYKNLVLRNAYDVYLLSKFTDTVQAISKFNKIKHPLNCYLLSCHEIFNNLETIKFIPSQKSKSYLVSLKYQLQNPKKITVRHKKIKFLIYLKHLSYLFYLSIFYKKYRVWLLRRIRDKKWLR